MYNNDDMGMIYNKTNECWTYFWHETKCHAEKLDNKITIYKSDTGEIIGIKINKYTTEQT